MGLFGSLLKGFGYGAAIMFVIVVGLVFLGNWLFV